MKTLIITLALISFQASAGVRCGNSLIEVGDSEYAVTQACGEPIDNHPVSTPAGGKGDESYSYYKVGTSIVEIHFIDGHVYTIGGDENRN